MLLKIVCVLFIILGVALFTVGMVLFLPIKYQVEIHKREKEKEFHVSGKITWLLRLCSCQFEYEQGKWAVKYRPRLRRKKKSENVGSLNKKNTEKKKSKTLSEEKQDHEAKAKDVKREYTIHKIYVRMKKIYLFLTNDVHVRAFQKTKEILLKNRAKWKPKKLTGFLKYGLEDPYDTGRILAVLSMFYPIYGENLNIYPEFERAVLETEIICEGTLSVFRIGILAFYFLRDEDVRETIKDFRRYQHDNEQI